VGPRERAAVRPSAPYAHIGASIPAVRSAAAAAIRSRNEGKYEAASATLRAIGRIWRSVGFALDPGEASQRAGSRMEPASRRPQRTRPRHRSTRPERVRDSTGYEWFRASDPLCCDELITELRFRTFPNTDCGGPPQPLDHHRLCARHIVLHSQPPVARNTSSKSSYRSAA
jgi:hypothetical protein